MAPAGWKPSKYKAIEPTLIEDLVKYYPDEYSVPTEDQLSSLGEDDYVMIVFVNKEEAWIYVEHVDEKDKVYGKLCNYPKHIELHKNQRVYFHMSRVAVVKDGFDDSD